MHLLVLNMILLDLVAFGLFWWVWLDCMVLVTLVGVVYLGRAGWCGWCWVGAFWGPILRLCGACLGPFGCLVWDVLSVFLYFFRVFFIYVWDIF